MVTWNDGYGAGQRHTDTEQSTHAGAFVHRGLALADSGAVFLCIPERVRLQLSLEAIDSKEVTHRRWLEKTDPIRLEDMDLVIFPRTSMLDINSAAPNFAAGIVKAAAQASEAPQDLKPAASSASFLTVFMFRLVPVREAANLSRESAIPSP